MISQQNFRPGSLTRNYLIHSFPAINSAVKIIFCISVVKKTDLGYVNKYIDATLIFYMYMPSYLQNAVEHPSREFHCMGMFRESNKNKWWEKHLSCRSSTFIDWNSLSNLRSINISLESSNLNNLTLKHHWISKENFLTEYELYSKKVLHFAELPHRLLFCNYFIWNLLI